MNMVFHRHHIMMTLDDLERSLCTLFQHMCTMVLLLIYIVSHSICF